jgi:DNA-binding transcriptional LysR family regulator
MLVQDQFFINSCHQRYKPWIWPVAWLYLDAPGCRRTLSLAWREDAYLSAAARAFRDFAIDHFRRQPAAE